MSSMTGRAGAAADGGLMNHGAVLYNLRDILMTIIAELGFVLIN
jgi:hypothetical protein